GGGGGGGAGERNTASRGVGHREEPLRAVVYRMAESGLTRFPVVERGPTRRLVGMIGLFDLLEGRLRNLEAERRRDRVLPVRFVLPRALRRRPTAPPSREAGSLRTHR